MKFRALLFLSILISPSICWGQTTLSSGVIDFLEVSYTTGPNPGWLVQIEDESTSQLFNPTFSSPLGRYVFDTAGGAKFNIAGPQHLFVRPSSDAIWGFIGVGGNQLFRATPQNASPATQLQMGIASLSDPGLFVQNKITITMSVTGITNPGEFSYYINDNSPNSAVGTSATPIFSTLTGLNTFNYTGTANFYNTAFSTPGIYHVDFQFSGVLSTGPTVTSEFYRYTFDVAPIAVPEPATWALLGVSVSVMIIGGWYIWHRRKLALDAIVPEQN